MPDVLFITPGPIEWASSRMRAHWVAEHLSADVIEYDDIKKHADRLSDYKAVVFIKTNNARLAQHLRNNNITVWWDICDPVHWFSPIEAKAMTESVDGIVASNHGLADDFSAWSGKETRVIADRLKISHFTPRERISTDRPVRFIWYGAYQNRFSLMAAFVYLERLTANGIDITLTICDDRPDQLWEYDKFPIFHIGWDLSQESRIITAHDIAVLPPYPGAWGRVKSQNKFITASACGVVPTECQEWGELHRLATRPDYRRDVAIDGLEWVRDHYDVRQSAQEWKDLLCV